MVLPSRLLPLLAIIATTICFVKCDYEENRENYIQYPPTAAGLLTEEVEDIGSPVALEVVTSLAEGKSTVQVWDLLKGIVHRMHKQNQILHVNAHFYISNGLDLGCRELQLNEDTGMETEIEVLPVPPQCMGACLHHGRYCGVAQKSFNPLADNRKGAALVEESLRRLCFVEIYHGSDLKFWEYMEAFDRLDCREAGDMRQCAMRAVGVVPNVEYPPLDACLRASGGLEADGVNIRLKQEMDKQTKGRNPFNLVDVPFIRVGGKTYGHEQVYTVPHIFEFVCDTFKEETGITPMACDFCGTCRGVRPCLWQLTCDGKPFNATHYHSEEEQIGLPPTTAAPIGMSSPKPTFAPTTGHPSAAPVVTTSLPQSPAPTFPPTEIQIPAPVNTNGTVLDISYISTNETGQSLSSGPSDETVAESPAAAPTMIDNSKPSALLSQGKFDDNGGNAYSQDDGDYRLYHPFLVYGVPVLVAAALLAVYFIVSYLHRRYHERQISSAEEYFNDLMDESYKDNMAISGRIEDEMSDRSMEDTTIEDMSGAAPPFASFKVHMVMA